MGCDCPCCKVYGPIPAKPQRVDALEIATEMLRALHDENEKLSTRMAELEALAREVVRHGTWVDETDVCLVHIDDCIYCMARAALGE